MIQTIKPPIKIAFIGGSIYSAIGYTHFTASQMDGLFNLVTGCFSRNETINKETAFKYGVPLNRLYSDWRELIYSEKNNIDAIVVLTPIPDHYEIVMVALENNVPIICEKPLGLSSVECRSIETAIKTHNNYLAVTLNYSGYPMVRQLKTMIENNLFGQLQQIMIEMPQESFLREDLKPQEWRQRDYYVPTVSLDLGIHVHHLIYFLSGLKPISICADQMGFGNLKNIIDTVYGMAHYENGMRAQICWSKTALGQRNGLKIRVFGSKGSAEWLQMNPEYLNWADNKGHYFILDRASFEATTAKEARYNRFKAGHPSGFIEAFANLYMDIADDILAFKHHKNANQPYRQNPFVFGVDHAIEGLSFIEAFDRSAKQKTWVNILNTDEYFI